MVKNGVLLILHYMLKMVMQKLT